MPVDDEINLDSPDGITQEDIDRMNEQADELERIAERSEINVEKIKQNMKSVEKNIVDIEDSGELSVSDNTSIEERLKEIEENQSKIITFLNKAEEERNVNRKKIDEAEQERKRILQEFRENSSGFREMYGEANFFRNDPVSFGRGKIKNLLGKAGIYGAVAMFAWEMAESLYKQIVSEVKGMYKAGGVFDIRKLVEDQVTEYNNINYLNKIKSGQVIFTADAGQDLVQGAVRGAYNTRDLRDGHLRYFQYKRGS